MYIILYILIKVHINIPTINTPLYTNTHTFRVYDPYWKRLPLKDWSELNLNIKEHGMSKNNNFKETFLFLIT